jgi:hypothetical protein
MLVFGLLLVVKLMKFVAEISKKPVFCIRIRLRIWSGFSGIRGSGLNALFVGLGVFSYRVAVLHGGL